MAPPTSTDDDALEQKRHELITLLRHTSRLSVDNEGEAMSTVQTRLLAEIRRIEVEEMRRHIASCPGLSPSSPAFDIALPALDEALHHIDDNSEKLEAGLMTNPGLMKSLLPSLISSKQESKNATFNKSMVYDDLPADVDILERVPTAVSPDSSVSESGDRSNDFIQTGAKTKAGAKTNSKKPKVSKKRSIFTRIVGALLRCLLMDLPLATTCLLLVASYS